MEYPQKNVFQMWVDSSGKPEGVWITRTTWPGLCARVTHVGELKGPPPYYGNPEVRADVYYPTGALKNRNFEITAPGTYKTWREIPAPPWWKLL